MCNIKEICKEIMRVVTQIRPHNLFWYLNFKIMPRKTKNVVFAATYKINEKGEEFTVGFDICKKFDKFTKRDQEKI